MHCVGSRVSLEFECYVMRCVGSRVYIGFEYYVMRCVGSRASLEFNLSVYFFMSYSAWVGGGGGNLYFAVCKSVFFLCLPPNRVMKLTPQVFCLQDIPLLSDLSDSGCHLI